MKKRRALAVTISNLRDMISMAVFRIEKLFPNNKNIRVKNRTAAPYLDLVSPALFDRGNGPGSTFLEIRVPDLALATRGGRGFRVIQKYGPASRSTALAQAVNDIIEITVAAGTRHGRYDANRSRLSFATQPDRKPDRFPACVHLLFRQKRINGHPAFSKVREDEEAPEQQA